MMLTQAASGMRTYDDTYTHVTGFRIYASRSYSRTVITVSGARKKLPGSCTWPEAFVWVIVGCTRKKALFH